EGGLATCLLCDSGPLFRIGCSCASFVLRTMQSCSNRKQASDRRQLHHGSCRNKGALLSALEHSFSSPHREHGIRQVFAGNACDHWPTFVRCVFPDLSQFNLRGQPHLDVVIKTSSSISKDVKVRARVQFKEGLC